MAATAATYATLALRRIAAVEGGDVLVVMLNRPKHANAMNSTYDAERVYGGSRWRYLGG